MQTSIDTIDLNAEVIRQLGKIVDSKPMMQRVLVFVKNLAEEKAKIESEWQPRSALQIEEDFRDALRDAKRYEKGDIVFAPAENLLHEL